VNHLTIERQCAGEVTNEVFQMKGLFTRNSYFQHLLIIIHPEKWKTQVKLPYETKNNLTPLRIVYHPVALRAARGCLQSATHP
jgi:hypothetical protein